MKDKNFFFWLISKNMWRFDVCLEEMMRTFISESNGLKYSAESASDSATHWLKAWEERAISGGTVANQMYAKDIHKFLAHICHICWNDDNENDFINHPKSWMSLDCRMTFAYQ